MERGGGSQRDKERASGDGREKNELAGKQIHPKAEGAPPASRAARRGKPSRHPGTVLTEANIDTLLDVWRGGSSNGCRSLCLVEALAVDASFVLGVLREVDVLSQSVLPVILEQQCQ